jgi:hypothetical protein
MNPWMNPWDAWMHGENYFPQQQTTLNYCAWCGALTDRWACERCRDTELSPRCHSLREEVRSGATSDSPTRNHITMLCDGAGAQWKRQCDQLVPWQFEINRALDRIMNNDPFWVRGDTQE